MEAQTIFYLAWIVVAGFIITKFYIDGKRALSIFPDISTNKIIYRDRSASGYSNQSRMTKMGGARNALDILVTDNELWLKSMILFAGIGAHYDLIHKIPFMNIININRDGKNITIDFKSEKGEHKQVVIITKRPDDFIKSIKK